MKRPLYFKGIPTPSVKRQRQRQRQGERQGERQAGPLECLVRLQNRSQIHSQNLTLRLTLDAQCGHPLRLTSERKILRKMKKSKYFVGSMATNAYIHTRQRRQKNLSLSLSSE